jgi:hypothetical protein
MGICIPTDLLHPTGAGHCMFYPNSFATQVACLAEEAKHANIVARKCSQVDVHDPDGKITQNLGLRD